MHEKLMIRRKRCVTGQPNPLFSCSRAPQDGVEGTWPRTVFLTFQFYHFPPVTTPRLQLVDMDSEKAARAAAAPQLLVQINKDGTPRTGEIWS